MSAEVWDVIIGVCAGAPMAALINVLLAKWFINKPIKRIVLFLDGVVSRMEYDRGVYLTEGDLRSAMENRNDELRHAIDLLRKL